MDYYKVLEVSPNASSAEIRSAYKRLAKLYHPDVNTSPHAKVLFQHISDSYQVLSDPARRAVYDSSRTNKFVYSEVNSAESTMSQRPRRNPASYRSSPPLRQEDLVRPYIRYAYTTSWLAFLLALVMTIDFFIPPKVTKETLSSDYYLPAAQEGKEFGQPQLVFTEEGTRMEIRAGKESLGITEGELYIEKTQIFQFPKKIVLDDGVQMEPLVLLHGRLSFFPVLLLLFGTIGAFFRQGVLFDFNVGLVSGVLMIITTILISATL
jgi:hypothetical protein